MAEKKKTSLLEKEALLLKKIEKTKKDLFKLRDKRQKELGKLACDAGLDAIDNETLKKQFAQLAKDIAHGNTEENKTNPAKSR